MHHNNSRFSAVSVDFGDRQRCRDTQKNRSFLYGRKESITNNIFLNKFHSNKYFVIKATLLFDKFTDL